MAIQSTKYITKTGICHNCWKQIEWTFNEEEYGYSGNFLIKCPNCGAIVQTKNKNITVNEVQGVAPQRQVGGDEMITITFYEEDSANSKTDPLRVIREYPKGQQVILPTGRDLFPNHLPSDYTFNCWYSLDSEDNNSYDDWETYIFNMDISLFATWTDNTR